MKPSASSLDRAKRIRRAVDRVVAKAMIFHNCTKDSELPKGKGIIGKLLRACARLDKVKKWNRAPRP